MLKYEGPAEVLMQTVQILMRRLVSSRLIRICTVCHSVFEISLKPLFALVDKSKFQDGRVHFRNSDMKGLRQILLNQNQIFTCDTSNGIHSLGPVI